MSTLLSGVRILDLADEKASFCSRLLADLGAEVLRIKKNNANQKRGHESCGEASSQHFTDPIFVFNNVNKKTIELDIEQTNGRNIFLSLVERSHAVVESFTVGFMKKIGLEYDILSNINPGIILASVSGFGQYGPSSRHLSCDLVAAATGGQMYTTGNPTGTPLKLPCNQSYFTGSLFAALGILIALKKVRHTGQGDHIDISLQEAVTATLEHVMIRFFTDNVTAQRKGRLHWNNFTHILPCRDGWMQMTLSHQWDTLVDWMESEGMEKNLPEPQWKEPGFRKNNIDHIITVLENWTQTHSVEELYETGQLMQFPWAPVTTPKRVLNCPQLKSRAFFKTLKADRTGYLLKYPGLPFTFSPSLPGSFNAFSDLGAQNTEIFRNLLRASKTAVKKNKKKDVPKNLLEDIRVIDFTRVVAGPYATRILSDFGADVIKIQTAATANGTEKNTSGYFNAWNRNKRSITLNMNQPKARELAKKLIASADVVVENFSPRVMKNWEMDYCRLKQIKPDIINLSMSGMGHTGPLQNHVAYGDTVQALSGFTFLTAYEKENPIGSGTAYGDTVSGIYGAIAVLAALEHREKTGQGLHVDLSEYEVLCEAIGPALLAAQLSSHPVLPNGNKAYQKNAAPHGCYPCLGDNRWCVISVHDEKQWAAFCNIMGNPSWVKEIKFSTHSQRIIFSDELDKYVKLWTSSQNAELLIADLQNAGIPAGIVKNAQDLADDKHLHKRGFFQKTTHPIMGKVFTDMLPINFKHMKKKAPESAPRLGQDNQSVFMDLLGLSENEFNELIDNGVIS